MREHVEAVRPHCDVEVVHLQRATCAGSRSTATTRPGASATRAGPPTLWHLRAARARPRGSSAGTTSCTRTSSSPGLPAVLFQRRPVVVSEHWSVFLPEDPASLGRGGRLARAGRVRPGRARPAGQRGAPARRSRRRASARASASCRTSSTRRSSGRATARASGPARGRRCSTRPRASTCCSTRSRCCPSERLRLVGDGPLRGALEAEAARLGRRRPRRRSTAFAAEAGGRAS